MVNKKVMGGFIILLLVLSTSMLLINIIFQDIPPKTNQITIKKSDTKLNPAIFNWDSCLTRSVGEDPVAIAFGDVNNDGACDIVTADYTLGNISILLWSISGNDWWRKDWALAPGCCGVAIGDANNDGMKDIVVVNNLTNQLTILLWNVSRNNWTQLNYGVGDSPDSVAIGDANNDHLNEIVETNYEDNNTWIFTWNLISQTWNIKSVNTGKGPGTVKIEDPDNDGMNEIVIANRLDKNIIGLQWSGLISDWTTDFTWALGYKPSDLAIGDANNNGMKDIVVVNQENNSISILLWNVPANNWTIICRGIGGGPSAITVDDVNADGQNDIVTANYGDSSVSILLWNSSNKNWKANSKYVGDGPRAVIIADVNNDGLLEITTANSLAATVSILTWNTTIGNLTPLISRSLGIYYNKFNTSYSISNFQITNSFDNSTHSGIYRIPIVWGYGVEKVIVTISRENLTAAREYFITPSDNSNYTTIQKNGGGGFEIEGAGQEFTLPYRSMIYNTSIFMKIKGSYSDNNGTVEFRDRSPSGSNNGTILQTQTIQNINLATAIWHTYNWSFIINETSHSYEFVLNGTNIGMTGREYDWYCQSFTGISQKGDVKKYGAYWQNMRFNFTFNLCYLPLNTTGTVARNFTIAQTQLKINGTGLGIGNSITFNKPVSALYFTTNISCAINKMTIQVFYRSLETTPSPIAIAVGDANNDGANDIAAVDLDRLVITVLCWNKSIGTWNPPFYLKAQSPPNSICIGDANNDGFNDIVTSSRSSPDVSIILWNKTTQNWNPFVTRKITDYGGESVVIADANNDGAKDIVVANPNQLPYVSMLLWNKTSKDWIPWHKTGVNGTGPPHKIAVADINNDGFNDIIASGDNLWQGYIWFCLWNSKTSTWNHWDDLLLEPIHPLTPVYTPPFSVGDLNNDGMKDIVVANISQNNVALYIWNSTKKGWNPPIIQFTRENPMSVAIGDINNDGANDIAIACNITVPGGTGVVSGLIWNKIAKNWQFIIPDREIARPFTTDPRSVTINDVTNDGKNDIIAGIFQDNTISVITFDRAPFIVDRVRIAADPRWTQNEDFGSFTMNLRTNGSNAEYGMIYGIDPETGEPKLKWTISYLDTTLIRVNNMVSIDGIFIFYSIENMNGMNTFLLGLWDGHNLQDSMFITIRINPVNDKPIILNKEGLRNNPNWTQTSDVVSFSINLTPYEFDAEDSPSALKWFVQDLNPGIATVQGENSTNHTLTFYIHGVGTSTFTLILMDSAGAIDTLTITLVVTLNLTTILFIVTTIISGAIIVIGTIYWRRMKARRTRLSKKTKQGPRKKVEGD